MKNSLLGSSCGSKYGMRRFINIITESQSDLPMDKASRMARAKQLGFTVAAYHGTTDKFNEFEFERGSGARTSGFAPHFTDKRKEAKGYAEVRGEERGLKGSVMNILLRIRQPVMVPNQFGQWDVPMEKRLSPELFEIIAGEPPAQDSRLHFGDAVYQLFQTNRRKSETTDNVALWRGVYSRLKASGYDAIIFEDTPGDHSDDKYSKIVMLDMSGIRLTSAVFDPAKANSTDLRA